MLNYKAHKNSWTWENISKKDFSEIEKYLRNKYRNKLNYEQEYKNYMNKLNKHKYFHAHVRLLKSVT